MGTRWRGILAPINAPTGDGRRMAPGAFTHRPLPLPLRWQRPETEGHDDAVTVGVIDTMHIDEDAGHVWGEGELFDDASPATTPRLAEDVAEAKLLLQKGAIGPSVDPGAASAMAVIAGTGEPLTEQRIFELMMAGATEVPSETLFTAYEIAGATLVPVPAFAECRPLELMEGAGALTAAEVREAVLAAVLTIDPLLFENPGLDRITPITRRKLANGLTHVFGHVAEHQTCLVGRRDVCTTPPYSVSEYSMFHRYHSSEDGSMQFPLPVGRLTAGFGQFEDTCRCCPGNDDHACANISFGAAVTHHDRLQVLAYVRAGEDETNNAIWISGVEAPGVSDWGQQLLSRQKVSGDWREIRGDMELTEILVLNRREPGFPLPRVGISGGRQRALTAAGVVRAPLDRQMVLVPPGKDIGVLDYDRLGLAVARALMAAAQEPEQPVAVTAAAPHDGAMLALRMTEQDAARLCVSDGLPMDELHMTLAYLGKADQMPPEVREKIEAEGRKLAASMQPVTADGFAVNVFNPGNTNDRDTALVLGVGGDALAQFHGAVTSMCMDGWDESGWQAPDQHQPWSPHVTLAYSDDLDRVKQMADRVGPITFDRLRMAFGGEIVDVPLGEIPVVGQGYDLVDAEMSVKVRDAQPDDDDECPEGKHKMPDGSCMDDDGDQDMSAITAAVRSEGWSSLPLAPDDHEWDDGAAIKRLVKWAEDDISGQYARAFLYRNADMDADLQTAYKFPVADVIDGTLTVVPNAVRNALSRLSQADIPAGDESRMRALLDKLMDRVHEQARERDKVATDSERTRRAKAAMATLSLTRVVPHGNLGVDNNTEEDTMGFNKHQRRGPDGKWIKGGGIGGGKSNGGGKGRGSSPADQERSDRHNQATEDAHQLLIDWLGHDAIGDPPARDSSKRGPWNDEVERNLLDAVMEGEGIDESDDPDVQRTYQAMEEALERLRANAPADDSSRKRREYNSQIVDVAGRLIQDLEDGAAEDGEEYEPGPLDDLLDEVNQLAREGDQAKWNAAVDRLRKALEEVDEDLGYVLELPRRP